MNEVAAFIHELETIGVPFEIRWERNSTDCAGLIVTVRDSATSIWEVGFYEEEHVEVNRYEWRDFQPISVQELLKEIKAKLPQQS